MPTTIADWAIIAAVVILIVAAVAIAAVYAQRRRRSDRLKQQFGAEYAHTVERLGDTSRAEADLAAREKRVQGLSIIPLTAADAARFRDSWNTLQGRFVDNPNAVVVQADQLVSELMQKRGYPMGDFESRAADVSVDHPSVVANYRAARAVAMRNQVGSPGGSATTEELREAVVHYRALFDELLEISDPRTAVYSSEEPAVVTPASATRSGRLSVQS